LLRRWSVHSCRVCSPSLLRAEGGPLDTFYPTLLTLDIDAVVVRDVRYPVETDYEKPGAGGIGVNRGAAKWIGANEEAARHVVTRGQSIFVPTDTVLAFQIQAPLRLRGYQR
jgi:hypothetical protein